MAPWGPLEVVGKLQALQVVWQCRDSTPELEFRGLARRAEHSPRHVAEGPCVGRARFPTTRNTF